MGQIIVVVNKYGESKIDAIGYTGESCVQATQSLEIALGSVGPRHLKPEYDEPSSVGGEVETSLKF